MWLTLHTSGARKKEEMIDFDFYLKNETVHRKKKKNTYVKKKIFFVFMYPLQIINHLILHEKKYTAPTGAYSS